MIFKTNWKERFLIATTCLLFLSLQAIGQNETPGVSEGEGGGMPGSPGMEDSESVYSEQVKQALKKGKTSREYIGALLGLGMHYNRKEQFMNATKTLRQALSIIDSGALKPAATSARIPEKIVEKSHGDGVVVAEVVRTPYPYEEMMQELLPQLITAELGANQLPQAEVHIKRLIGVKGPNEVADKMSHMSAYASYAELMRKLNRPKDAELYQRKFDEINSSFKPL